MKLEHQYDANSRKITVEIPKDADIHEVMDAFYAFLIGCTYHPKSIEKGLQGLVEKLDELAEKTED